MTHKPSEKFPAPISKFRTNFALFSLSLGGFGIGLTEFSSMGLLSQFSRDLLPELYASNPELANSQSGWLVTAYALGVVIGAPTIGIFAAKFPQKKLILTLLGLFVLGSALSAAIPGFYPVLIARFLSGLPHGAYFGVAAIMAARLMPADRRAQGIALVLGGLAIANVIGVPLVTWLGQNAHWRLAYAVVALVFAVTFLLVLISLPEVPGDPNSTAVKELAAFRKPQVWLAILTGAIGFGGFFAIYSYIDPLITQVTMQPEWMVPIVLVIVGCGMTAGNFFGGWFTDKGVKRAILTAFAIMIAVCFALPLVAGQLIPAVIVLFLVGFGSSVLSPAVQVRLIDVAGDSKTVAATTNHAALNIGNALGAYLGSVVIAAGFGYLAPAYVALALTVIGLIFGLISFGVERSKTSRVVKQELADSQGS